MENVESGEAGFGQATAPHCQTFYAAILPVTSPRIKFTGRLMLLWNAQYQDKGVDEQWEMLWNEFWKECENQ